MAYGTGVRQAASGGRPWNPASSPSLLDRQLPLVPEVAEPGGFDLL